MENRTWRIKIREKAWETVKNRNEKKMVHEINNLYYSLFHAGIPLVSVVIPTKDHPEAFTDCLVAAIQQDYPKMEIVVADSGDVSIGDIVNEARKHTDVPIKYIYFNRRGTYSLAEARNRAIIEADGEWITFCDDRIRMNKDAVKVFEIYKRPRSWLWGVKDGSPKSFIENFSFAPRRDLIAGGLFCERMRWYGGMTQEIRTRFESERGMDFIFIDEAKAEGIRRSRSINSRRSDIVEAKYLIYKMYNK